MVKTAYERKKKHDENRRLRGDKRVVLWLPIGVHTRFLELLKDHYSWEALLSFLAFRDESYRVSVDDAPIRLKGGVTLAWRHLRFIHLARQDKTEDQVVSEALDALIAKEYPDGLPS